MKSKRIEFEGVKLWSHELATIKTLRKYGYDAKVVIPSGIMKTADILIENRLWEIKSPTGKSRKSTIESQFSRGKKQSSYLIIDSRRTKLADSFIEKKIRSQLNTQAAKSVRGVIFIKKDEKIVDFLNCLLYNSLMKTTGQPEWTAD